MFGFLKRRPLDGKTYLSKQTGSYWIARDSCGDKSCTLFLVEPHNNEGEWINWTGDTPTGQISFVSLPPQVAIKMVGRELSPGEKTEILLGMRIP